MLVLTVPAVYWARVVNRRIRPLLELSAVIPFALPFVVIGFALLIFSGIAFPSSRDPSCSWSWRRSRLPFPFVYWTIDGFDGGGGRQSAD